MPTTSKLLIDAVSSMNYLFLRYATDKPESRDSIAVHEELDIFLTNLNNEAQQIPDGIKTEIHRELHEGNYFDSIKELESKLHDALVEITGEDLPVAFEFYKNLYLTPETN